MRNLVIQYGLFSGGLLVLLLVAPYYWLSDFEYWTVALWRYTAQFMGAAVIYFGIRHFRKTRKYRRMHFGRLFGLGVSISVVSGVFLGGTMFFLFTLVAPHLSHELYDQQLNTILDMEVEIEGDPREQLAQMEGDFQVHHNPFHLSLRLLVNTVLYGVIAAFLSANLLRRKASRYRYRNYTEGSRNM